MNDPVNGPPLPPPLLEPPTPAHAPVGKFRWWLSFVLIGVYPLVVGLLSVGRAENRAPALSHSASGLLLMCAFEIFIFGILFSVTWLISRASIDDLRLRWRGGLWPILLGVAYSVGVRMAIAGVAIIVAVGLLVAGVFTPRTLQDFVSHNRPDVETLVDVDALRHNPLYLLLSLTLVSFVLAGLREELWRSAFLAGTRAVWPSAFGSRAGQMMAAALAAVIFGLGHLPQGPLGVCLTGFLGLVLGVIMILHNSIWPAVIAHGAFDATTLALIPFALEQVQRLPHH